MMMAFLGEWNINIYFSVHFGFCMTHTAYTGDKQRGQPLGHSFQTQPPKPAIRKLGTLKRPLKQSLLVWLSQVSLAN